MACHNYYLALIFVLFFVLAVLPPSEASLSLARFKELERKMQENAHSADDNWSVGVSDYITDPVDITEQPQDETERSQGEGTNSWWRLGHPFMRFQRFQRAQKL
uniref:Uncharacterized protein n=1 Tax=Plectus sambesii TaxID=2011161 RepID=A0A914XCC7_9BILA